MNMKTPNRVVEAGSDKPDRKGLSGIALAAGLIFMTVIIGRMIYHDSLVDVSAYSNCTFALPGAGISLILVVYACIRLCFLPLWLRLTIVPYACSAGCVGIGLLVILINAGN